MNSLYKGIVIAWSEYTYRILDNFEWFRGEGTRNNCWDLSNHQSVYLDFTLQKNKYMQIISQIKQ